MEFKEAMRIWKRMCESNGQCEHCPIPAYDATLCRAWVMMHADRANDILAKWAAGHPERTIADDFYEKHPKALGFGDKKPLVCAVHCGYIDRCPYDCSSLQCEKCWSRPLEEVEG